MEENNFGKQELEQTVYFFLAMLCTFLGVAAYSDAQLQGTAAVLVGLAFAIWKYYRRSK